MHVNVIVVCKLILIINKTSNLLLKFNWSDLIIWLRSGAVSNSIIVAIIAAIIVVVHTRPSAIPLAMITMGKSIHGFPFLSYMGMGLCLAALWATKAPLKAEQETAIIIYPKFQKLLYVSLWPIQCKMWLTGLRLLWFATFVHFPFSFRSLKLSLLHMCL